MSIVCEQSKLQVVDAGEKVDPATSPVSDIAVNYAKTLPHVRYTGLGVNFKAMIPSEQPSHLLMDTFLKEGSWSAPSRRLEDMGLRLVYAIDHGRLQLSLDAGEAKAAKARDSQEAILAGANFHHDLSEESPVDQMEQIVKRKTEYWEHLQDLLSQIVNGEGRQTG